MRGEAPRTQPPDRVEDITQALRGTKVSPGTVSNLNQKVYDRIEQWRSRALERRKETV